MRRKEEEQEEQEENEEETENEDEEEVDSDLSRSDSKCAFRPSAKQVTERARYERMTLSRERSDT